MEKVAHHSKQKSDDSEFFSMDLGVLDLTNTEEIDLSEVGADLSQFQQDPIVKEALAKGVDLRQYSRQIDEELKSVEIDSIHDYAKEATSLVELNKEIKNCDGILERMEQMLGDFQSHLGSISAEIRSLQDRSLVMNSHLRNRKEVEVRLGGFIDAIIVPPELVSGLNNLEVGPEWLEMLSVLNIKLRFLRGPVSHSSEAARDVSPLLDKLKIKATQKIRSFLLQKFNDLRRRTNIQINQSILLKYRKAYLFLLEHTPDIAAEIRHNYSEIMGKVHANFFKGYLVDISKLRDPDVVDKNDLLGIQESSHSQIGEIASLIFSSPSKTAKKTPDNTNEKSINSSFKLGSRIVALEEAKSDEDVGPLIYEVAQQQGRVYKEETLFRASTRLLVETSTTEFGFVDKFFGDQELFLRVFAKTFLVFNEHLEVYLQTSHDSISLLLLIRISYQHNQLMNRRGLKCLDQFFAKLQDLIWPKFRVIFESNLRSLHDLEKPTESKTKTPSKTTHRQPTNIIPPSFISSRYGEYTGSLRVLSRGHENEQLSRDLLRLYNVVDEYICSMATSFSTSKQQTVYLINNFDLILRILLERVGTSEEVTLLEESLSRNISHYVEQELDEIFGRLIVFLRHSEQEIENNGSNPKVEIETAKNIVQNFASTWRDRIEKINSNVNLNFGSPITGVPTQFRQRNAVQILKRVLSQLLLYYQRFGDIINKLFRNESFYREFIPPLTLLYEIKKYGSRNE